MVAKKIYTSVPAKAHSTQASKLREYQYDEQYLGGKPMVALVDEIKLNRIESNRIESNRMKEANAFHKSPNYFYVSLQSCSVIS